MYIIKRNGKKTVRLTFSTYEQARQHVRKLIRKQFHLRANRQPDCYFGGLGYEIAKV